MLVSISRVHFPVTTLGPGRRVGIWFQGCSIRCPGCISMDTWDDKIGSLQLAQLLPQLSRLAQAADGLTISGGEPFDQPAELAAILKFWRSTSKRTILVFTGRELSDVSAWLESNPGLIDAIMTGPFRSDLPQRLALRGSDNQQLHMLTEAGREMSVFDRPATLGDRRLDVMFDEEGSAWLAGIPARGELGRLRRVLAAAGHKAFTSDAAGAVR